MGRKLGRGLRPLFGEGRGSHVTQSRLGRGLPPYQKLGDVPLWGGEAGTPSNTDLHKMSEAQAYLHAKVHLDPSNRLATVHQRYRQDRQTDNGPTA